MKQRTEDESDLADISWIMHLISSDKRERRKHAHECVAPGVVSVGGLGKGGDVTDVVEDVVTEDSVRSADRVLPAANVGDISMEYNG